MTKISYCVLVYFLTFYWSSNIIGNLTRESVVILSHTIQHLQYLQFHLGKWAGYQIISKSYHIYTSFLKHFVIKAQ